MSLPVGWGERNNTKPPENIFGGETSSVSLKIEVDQKSHSEDPNEVARLKALAAIRESEETFSISGSNSSSLPLGWGDRSNSTSIADLQKGADTIVQQAAYNLMKDSDENSKVGIQKKQDSNDSKSLSSFSTKRVSFDGDSSSNVSNTSNDISSVRGFRAPPRRKSSITAETLSTEERIGYLSPQKSPIETSNSYDNIPPTPPTPPTPITTTTTTTSSNSPITLSNGSDDFKQTLGSITTALDRLVGASHVLSVKSDTMVEGVTMLQQHVYSQDAIHIDLNTTGRISDINDRTSRLVSQMNGFNDALIHCNTIPNIHNDLRQLDEKIKQLLSRQSSLVPSIVTPASSTTALTEIRSRKFDFNEDGTIKAASIRSELEDNMKITDKGSQAIEESFSSENTGIIQIIHEDVILLLEGFTQLMRRLPTNSNDVNDIKEHTMQTKEAMNDVLPIMHKMLEETHKVVEELHSTVDALQKGMGEMHERMGEFKVKMSDLSGADWKETDKHVLETKLTVNEGQIAVNSLSRGITNMENKIHQMLVTNDEEFEQLKSMLKTMTASASTSTPATVPIIESTPMSPIRALAPQSPSSPASASAASVSSVDTNTITNAIADADVATNAGFENVNAQLKALADELNTVSSSTTTTLTTTLPSLYTNVELVHQDVKAIHNDMDDVISAIVAVKSSTAALDASDADIRSKLLAVDRKLDTISTALPNTAALVCKIEEALNVSLEMSQAIVQKEVKDVDRSSELPLIENNKHGVLSGLSTSNANESDANIPTLAAPTPIPAPTAAAAAPAHTSPLTTSIEAMNELTSDTKIMKDHIESILSKVSTPAPTPTVSIDAMNELTSDTKIMKDHIESILSKVSTPAPTPTVSIEAMNELSLTSIPALNAEVQEAKTDVKTVLASIGSVQSMVNDLPRMIEHIYDAIIYQDHALSETVQSSSGQAADSTDIAENTVKSSIQKSNIKEMMTMLETSKQQTLTMSHDMKEMKEAVTESMGSNKASFSSLQMNMENNIQHYMQEMTTSLNNTISTTIQTEIGAVSAEVVNIRGVVFDVVERLDIMEKSLKDIQEKQENNHNNTKEIMGYQNEKLGQKIIQVDSNVDSINSLVTNMNRSLTQDFRKEISLVHEDVKSIHSTAQLMQQIAQKKREKYQNVSNNSSGSSSGTSYLGNTPKKSTGIIGLGASLSPITASSPVPPVLVSPKGQQQQQQQQAISSEISATNSRRNGATPKQK